MKNLTAPPSFIDLRDVDFLHIQISDDGKTIWVNTDYGCALRVQRIKQLELDDSR